MEENRKKSIKLLIILYTSLVTITVFIINPELPWNFCASETIFGTPLIYAETCMSFIEFWIASATHYQLGIPMLIISSALTYLYHTEEWKKILENY